MEKKFKLIYRPGLDESGIYKCPDHGEFLSPGAVKVMLKKMYGLDWEVKWEEIKKERWRRASSHRFKK